MQSLKPTGLPAANSRSRAMKCTISTGVANAGCRAGDTQSSPTAGRRDFGRYLGGRKHAAVAGLGALRQLDLDHLDLRIARGLFETLGAKRAILIAAPKIAAAEFPDDVAAELAVIFAKAAFAGIVREPAELRPLVERADRVSAQRPEAHRRDVEERERVRLLAVGPADDDAKIVTFRRARRD
jgi:hypothetical protein